MPLRDHFSDEFKKRMQWESFHYTWPVKLVEYLKPHLPKPYYARPGIHVGARFESDVAAYESYEPDESGWQDSNIGGVATLPNAVKTPSWLLEADFTDIDRYEVKIYDESYSSRLVAAVEFVSPSNKDRPDHRRLFVTKCANLLNDEVAVTIVDVITSRNGNLGRDVMEMVKAVPPRSDAPSLYVTTLLPRASANGAKVRVWEQELELGDVLPVFPLWLSPELCINVDLESSYQSTLELLSY